MEAGGGAPDWKSGSCEGRLSAAQTEERRQWMANGFSEKNLTPSHRADPSLLGKGEKLIRRAYVSPYSDPALKGRAI